jgi:hypothetical protein
MSRPLRIQYPAAVYHIMNRSRARQPTFVDETDYRAFLDTLAEAHRQWGSEVGVYLRGHPLAGRSIGIDLPLRIFLILFFNVIYY